MLFGSLTELKAILQIDPENNSEDKLLSFYLWFASGWIETYLNRPGYIKRERTMYYDGTGTQNIDLKVSPVYLTPTPRVWVDLDGRYGQNTNPNHPFTVSTAALTFGTDFMIPVDDDSGVARKGVLVRVNALWPRPVVRQVGYLSPFVGDSHGNVKVTFTAGYSADSLPPQVVLATTQMVAKMREMFPLGTPLTSESYEDRSISRFSGALDKHWLTAQIKPLLFPFRRHYF